MLNQDAETRQMITEQEASASSSGSVASNLCMDSSARVLNQSMRFNRCNPLTSLRRPDPRRVSPAGQTSGIGLKRERASSGGSSGGDLSLVVVDQNANTANNRLRSNNSLRVPLRRNISSGASTISRMIGSSKNATFHDFRSNASRFGGSAGGRSAMMNSSFGVLSLQLQRPRSLHVSVHATGASSAGGCMKNSSFSK